MEPTHEYPLPDPSQAPAIPPKVRSAAYFTALITGAVATGATGVVAALAAASIVDVSAIALTAGLGGAVTSVVATINGGLGVAYRPTKAS